MRRTFLYIIPCMASAVSLPAYAADHGVVCMEPRVVQSSANPSLSDLPKVYSAPNLTSPSIGITSSVVYAVSPLEKQNGFTKVIHLNGKTGWVESASLTDWRNQNLPSTVCTADLRPNGRPYAKYHS